MHVHACTVMHTGQKELAVKAAMRGLIANREAGHLSLIYGKSEPAGITGKHRDAGLVPGQRPRRWPGTEPVSPGCWFKLLFTWYIVLSHRAHSIHRRHGNNELVTFTLYLEIIDDIQKHETI